jgi:hypothetical protein
MRVPHDYRMPDAIGASEVTHQRYDYKNITQKGSQYCGSKDGPETLETEDVHARCYSEATRRKPDTAENVKADPQTLGKLVAQLRHRPQTLSVPHIRRIDPDTKEQHEDCAPECELLCDSFLVQHEFWVLVF